MSDLQSPPLSRSDLANLVDVLLSPEKRGRDTWRIAEVLDLLLDAGQFKLALDLANDIIRRLDSVETERLFVAYKKYCELMVFGVVGDNLDELRRFHSIINDGGHSTADKTRASLLLARALLFGVKTGVLSDQSVLRARKVLIDRLSETSESKDISLLYIELTKSYIHAREPELCAARGVMLQLETSAAMFGLFDDVQFDVACLEYTLNASLNGADFSLELSFRNQFCEASPIARALQELVIQKTRAEKDVELEALQRCADTLEAHGFLVGAFEAFFLLAKILLATRRNVPALRMATCALRNAEKAGFLYGEVGAKLLLSEIYLLGGGEREREKIAISLRERYLSELIVISYGSSLAILQASVASKENLVRYADTINAMASSCIPTFSRMSLLSLVARTYFQAQKWREAQQAWDELALWERKEGLLLESYSSQLLGARCSIACALGTSPPVSNELDAVELRLVQLIADLNRFFPIPKAKLGLARAHILRAQLQGARGTALEALKHLSTARELCEQLGSVTELAAVECSTGSLLLQVGDRSDPSILESAVLSLRRADEFYRVTGHAKARMKTLYFLASSANRLANLQPSRLKSLRWRRLAMSWIGECDAMHRKVSRRSSPELEPDCFDATPEVSVTLVRSLKRSLFAGRRRSLGRKGAERQTNRFAGEVLH